MLRKAVADAPWPEQIDASLNALSQCPVGEWQARESSPNGARKDTNMHTPKLPSPPHTIAPPHKKEQ